MNMTQSDRFDGEVNRVQPDPAVYPTPEPTLGELISSLSEDFSNLVRKELKLARVETMESVSTASRGAGLMAAGGMVAYAGLIIVLIGIAVLIGQAIDSLWLASLLVGVLVLGVGGVLFYTGKSALKNFSLTPEKTIDSLKEDARWVKEQVS